MAAEALEVEGLTAGYGATVVVEAVGFSLRPAERLALIGRNGAGKTTLVASLVGQTRRHAGTIRLGGVELTALPPALRARAGLGYVPQTRAIFASLSVAENLIVGLNGRPRAALDEAYQLFPRLKERAEIPGAKLSGGEQQMLAVARTLLGRPKVLLLDEPLEGLAPILCDELMQAFERLAATRSCTIVLVEQQIGRALAFAERAIILERGRIAWDGPSAALQADEALIERYLGVGAAG